MFDLQEYEEKGLLKSQAHPTLPLSIYNYSEKCQFDNAWDEVLLQCRGLVIDEETGEVVARCIPKFFNLEEGRHTPTKDYETFEKLDGSLIQVFFYNGHMVVSSRGSFTSDQAKWAEEIIKEKGLYTNVFRNFYKFNFIFELIHPENRICVDYGNTKELVLLAVTNVEEGELPYNQAVVLADYVGCPVVQPIDSDHELERLKETISDNEEGYVIKFSNGERVKIKGEEYVRLHALISNLSTTAVWKLLKDGHDFEEFLQNFPDEYFNLIKEYKEELEKEFEEVFYSVGEDYHDIMCNLPIEHSEKDFALKVQETDNSSYLFNFHKGNLNKVKQQIWKKLRPTYRMLN